MNGIELHNGSNEDFLCLAKLINLHEGWLMSNDEYEKIHKCCGGKVCLKVAKTKEHKLVGSCLLIGYDDTPFIAFYFVVPEYRGQGIGKALLDSTYTAHLQETNVGLLSVVKQSKMYDAVYGFNKYTPWVSEVFELKNINIAKFKDCGSGPQVKNANEIDLSLLYSYDAESYGSRRDKFLDSVVVHGNSTCKVLIDENGRVVGYGRIRPTIVDALIYGPIYSDTDQGFLMLINELIMCYPIQLENGSRCIIRIPSTKSSAVAKLLEGVAMVKKLGYCIPQFTKFVPNHNLEKVYALTDNVILL